MRLSAIPLLLLAGCASAPRPASSPPAQSLADALVLTCDVDRLAALGPGADPLALGRARSAWLAAHVESPDAIELLTLVSVKGASEQASMLRARSREAGLPRCALADALEADETGALSP